jgi:phosphoglycerol transferase MdoB-like AlkP superfamily enzyme
MLLFMVDQLSSSQNPFFAGVFTLSSHHPYFIPERLRSLFKQGPLEIHKSIGYADYALKMFFEKAQKTKWFKETIFIITADHTQKNHEVSYQYFSGDYRVPMIIYSESNQFKDRFLAERDEYLTKVTQAVDVPHIILELMGVDHRPRLPPFGANTLNKGVKGLAVNYNGFQYWLRSEDRIVAIDPKGQMTENLKVDSKGFLKEKRTANNEINELVDVLKSMVSIFNKSMRQNSLYKEQTPSKE